MKLRLEIEVEVDDEVYCLTKYRDAWLDFFGYTLTRPIGDEDGLVLHTNHHGDAVGPCRVVQVISFEGKKP